MNFIGRWFTPSNSDGGFTAPSQPAPKRAVKGTDAAGQARAKTKTRFAGASTRLNMFGKSEAQIAKKLLLGE